MNGLRNYKYWIILVATLFFYILFKAKGMDATLLVLRLTLLVGMYVAAVMDFLTKRVPNLLVIIMALGWGLIVSPRVLFDIDSAIEIIIRGVFGFIIAVVVMMAVYLISKKGLGGADVKLMSVAGLYLGYDGTLSALLYGSLLSAIFAVLMVVLKKMTTKDAIPLVPFLYIGVVMTEFFR